MKKLLLLTLSLTAMALTLRADNLLKNPSFETEGKSSDTAADWERWGNWINRETTWNPTNSGSCLVGYHHWQIDSSANSGIWQDLGTVKAGQKFKFTIHAFADKPGGDDHAAEKIELRLEAMRNGQQVTIASASFPVSDFQGDSAWHALSVSGMTPEDNIRVLVVVTPSSVAPRGGAVKIDDAFLELEK